MEHGIVCAENKVVTPNSLPQDIRSYCGEAVAAVSSLSEEEEGQRQEVLKALEKAKGSRAVAATLLGIDRTTLWRRMQKLGLS